MNILFDLPNKTWTIRKMTYPDGKFFYVKYPHNRTGIANWKVEWERKPFVFEDGLELSKFYYGYDSSHIEMTHLDDGATFIMRPDHFNLILKFVKEGKYRVEGLRFFGQYTFSCPGGDLFVDPYIPNL